MTRQNVDPAAVASRYRVKQLGEHELELFAPTKDRPNIGVRRHSAAIRISATPHALRWHADEGEPFYSAEFAIGELTIGNRGDEGWSSALVDNCFFVVDGETLRHLPLLRASILVADRYNFEVARNAANKGEIPSSQDANSTLARDALGHANIVHCAAMPEFGLEESLELTVGLPSLHFQKLVDGCINGRVSGLHFHGSGAALSSSFEYGSARDVILRSGASLNIRIDGLTIDFRA